MDRRRDASKGLLIRAAVPGILLAVAFTGVGCGLFETRKPTDPGGNTFPCSSLQDPNNVFTNLRLAYGQGAGLSCYLSCLDPTFYFHADPADSIDTPSKFTNWAIAVEEQTSRNLANDADDIGITYTSGPELVTTDTDLEIRRYTYEIVFAGGAIEDTLFQGIAEITIRRSSTTGLWLVTEWFDRRDPSGTTTRTWGYLRGSYRL